MSEKLVIEIDTSQAQTELEKLKAKFAETTTSVEQGAEKASEATKKIAEPLKGGDAVKQLGSMTTAVNDLAKATQSVRTTFFQDLGTAFQMLGNGDSLKLIAGYVKQLGANIASVALDGFKAGLNLLAGAATTAAAALGKLLLRLGPLLIAAAAAAVIAKLGSAFMEGQAAAEAFSRAVGQVDIKSLGNKAQESVKAIQALGEKLGLTKEQVGTLGQAFIAGSLGAADWRAELQKSNDVLKEQQAAMRGAIGSILQQLTGIQQQAQAQGGLTAAQAAYQKELMGQLNVLAQVETRTGNLIGANNALMTATKGASDASKEAGISTDELLKRYDATKGSTEQLAQAFGAVKSTGISSWFTELGASSLTFSRSLGEMSGSWGTFAANAQVASTALQPLPGNFAQLTNLLPSLSSSLPTVNEPLAVMSQSFTTLNQTLPPTATAFQALDGNLQTVAQTAPLVAEGFGQIAEVGNQLQGLPSVITNLAKATESLQSALASVEGATEKAASALRSLEQATDGAKGATDAIQSVMQSAASNANELAAAYLAAAAAARELAAEQSRLKDGAGGGSTSTEGGRQGGRVGELIDRQRVNMDAFNNAPSFAKGGFTDNVMSKLPGAGKPIIAHPNEAVVPLSKGRKIGVELQVPKIPQPTVDLQGALAPLTTSIAQLSRDVRQSDIAAKVAQMTTEIAGRSGTVQQPPAGDAIDQASPDGESRTKSVTINLGGIHISALDVDAFKRSQDQIAAETGRRIRRAMSRVE